MLQGNVQGNIPDCNNMKENDVDGDQEFPGGKTLPAYLTGSFVFLWEYCLNLPQTVLALYSS